MIKDGKLHLAKYAPPPVGLPVYQQVDPRDVSFIGRTNYEAPGESNQFIFGIKRKDRKRHLYIVGKTGVGKSKMVELLMRQDVTYGHGFCLIDPQGKLVQSMLDFIPEERMRDVIVLDPTDGDFPVSFNPFANVPADVRHHVVQGMVEAMAQQFGASWSHRIEHVLRLTLLALLDYPEATLHGVISLLTDAPFRSRIIAHISDDMVKRFFEAEFDDWALKFEADAIMPIVNHLSKFLAIPSIRSIFVQKENKIDLDDIIAHKKILLVSLAKGKIGDQNGNFLGALVMNKLRQAGMARRDLPDESRKDFNVYLYEFHSLMFGSFMNLFSEARGYGFCITAAHQYVAQLDPGAFSNVLGNAGTIIVFRVGGEDAEKLEPEMNPVFKAKDMINLATREFYIKQIIDGEAYDPFSAETLNVLPPPYASRRTNIIEMSRSAYAMPLGKVRELYYGA